jgi:hypothetical protein
LRNTFADDRELESYVKVMRLFPSARASSAHSWEAANACPACKVEGRELCGDIIACMQDSGHNGVLFLSCSTGQHGHESIAKATSFPSEFFAIHRYQRLQPKLISRDFARDLAAITQVKGLSSYDPERSGSPDAWIWKLRDVAPKDDPHLNREMHDLQWSVPLDEMAATLVDQDQQDFGARAWPFTKALLASFEVDQVFESEARSFFSGEMTDAEMGRFIKRIRAWLRRQSK